jgi:cytochrome c oxidase cbb3-type subunit 3
MSSPHGADDGRDPSEPGEPVTQHVYDDIVEHDNKLPLWWQLTLYGTVLFGLVYWFGRRYDAIQSPVQAYQSDVAAQHAADAERARARGTIDDAMLSTLAMDPSTLALGKEVFVATCAPCHKPDAGGNIGPNLTDAYWIHGGKPTDIYKTVTDGVAAKGMPTWTPVLGEQRVEAVVAYVISIANSNVPGGKAPQGELAAR